jgi:hypothetical protein
MVYQVLHTIVFFVYFESIAIYKIDFQMYKWCNFLVDFSTLISSLYSYIGPSRLYEVGAFFLHIFEIRLLTLFK